MAVNSSCPHGYLKQRFPERYRKARGIGVTLLTPAMRQAEALFVGDLKRLPLPPNLALEARPVSTTWENL